MSSIRFKKLSNQLTSQNQVKVEAGKDVALALTCKRCTSFNRKLTDRAREFIESTFTSKRPSTPCLKQRSGWSSRKYMSKYLTFDVKSHFLSLKEEN